MYAIIPHTRLPLQFKIDEVNVNKPFHHQSQMGLFHPVFPADTAFAWTNNQPHLANQNTLPVITKQRKLLRSILFMYLYVWLFLELYGCMFNVKLPSLILMS